VGSYYQIDRFAGVNIYMNNKLTLEIVWWVSTFVLALLVILPIYTSVGLDFMFYIENILSIVVFVTLARWLFLLRHTFFGWNKKVKVVILFLMIPLFFICYDNLIDFQAYIDEQDIMTIVKSLPNEDQLSMAKYIRYEYVFFGVAALMTIIMTPFRIVISVWRQINKGTV